MPLDEDRRANLANCNDRVPIHWDSDEYTLRRGNTVYLALPLALCLTAVPGLGEGAMNDDQQRTEELFAAFQQHVQSGAHDSLAAVLAEMAADPEFLPMHGRLLAGMILHPDQLDLAEDLATTSIATNSAEKLERYSPGMGNPVKVDGLYQDLHSLRGWIRWKRERLAEAWEDMQTAVQYRDQRAEPSEHGTLRLSAEDLLRLGIIAHDVGQPRYGWAKISEGIILDDAPLATDPAYQVALTRIVQSRYGDDADLEAIVTGLRTQAAEPLPDMALVTLDGGRLNLDGGGPRPRLMLFFSPACGSCQHEIAGLKGLYADLADGSAQIIFILNRPEQAEAAKRLLKRHGLEGGTVAVLESGSAYDFIPGEPSTWIVDAGGTVVRKYVGYTRGDEERYRQELSGLSGASN